MTRLPGEAREVLWTEGDLNDSPLRQNWVTSHVDAATQKILDEDARYFLHQSLSTPCLNVLRSCIQSRLEDWQGRLYLDFHGNAVHQVGFGHERVVQAVIDQLRKLPFCTRRYTNEPAVALARKLAELAPGRLNKVLFAPGGALAMSMSLKLARAATGRFKTISMWDSFHGASLDTISIGGETQFREGIGPLLTGSAHVPPPNPDECPFDCGQSCTLQCADYLEYVLRKEGDVAAVVAETVRSAPFFPPVEYWQQVRAACDRHGALLILDEIPHALGRTGKMFTCEHYGIEPDMLVIGKGLGGGVFPMAALLAREDLDVGQDHSLGHFTHEKSPVGCTAALATLDVIEEEQLLARATRLGTWALDLLKVLQEEHPLIIRVRGKGMMLGIDLLHSAEEVMYRCLAGGLNFKITMGKTLQLMPPLTISREEFILAVRILDRAIGSVESELE